MARRAKVRTEFAKATATFPYRVFRRLLEMLGYDELARGKTGGSRRKFYNPEIDHLITLDEPHSGVMSRGMVKRLQKQLNEKGLL